MSDLDLYLDLDFEESDLDNGIERAEWLAELHAEQAEDRYTDLVYDPPGL